MLIFQQVTHLKTFLSSLGHWQNVKIQVPERQQLLNVRGNFRLKCSIYVMELRSDDGFMAVSYRDLLHYCGIFMQNIVTHQESFKQTKKNFNKNPLPMWVQKFFSQLPQLFSGLFSFLCVCLYEEDALKVATLWKANRSYSPDVASDKVWSQTCIIFVIIVK